MTALTSGKQSLRSSLMNLFAQRAAWTAEQFLAELPRIYKKVSKQALYKELRQLEEDGMVVRASRSYTLRLAWVLELSAFANTLQNLLLEQDGIVAGFELKEGIEEWEFSDLHRADLFWTQLILALLKHNPSRKIYSWIPHPWFHIVHADREKEFWNALHFYQPQFLISVGGATPLDKEWISIVDTDCATVRFGGTPLHTSPSTCFELHGDYLVVVTLDRRTTEEIDHVFSTIASVNELTPPMLMRLIGRDGRIIVRVEKGTPRVERMRAKFLEHFSEATPPAVQRAANARK